MTIAKGGRQIKMPSVREIQPAECLNLSADAVKVYQLSTMLTGPRCRAMPLKRTILMASSAICAAPAATSLWKNLTF